MLESAIQEKPGSVGEEETYIYHHVLALKHIGRIISIYNQNNKALKI